MVITHEPLKIEGQGISGGMAKGKLRFLKHREISESDTGAPLSPEEELSRLASAIEKAQEQLSELYTNTANSVGEKEAEIFRIHSMLLDDEEFKGAAENFISQGMSAVEAVRRAGEAVAGMHGRPVVIRTLDIGADKKADYFALPEEENPALGMRAIRLCLSRPEVFKTQLRAICRASAFGKAHLRRGQE